MTNDPKYLNVDFDLNLLSDDTFEILDAITRERRIYIEDLIAEVLIEYTEQYKKVNKNANTTK